MSPLPEITAPALYFAYGSNLDEARMRERCPGGEVIGRACLPDHRLQFTLYFEGWECGVADVVPAPGEEVWGLLYRLQPADWPPLDEYEETPTLYLRKQVPVTGPDGPAEAWVYYVREPGPFVAPNRRYLAVMLEAAERHQFPPPYREALRRVPVNHWEPPG